MADADPRRDGEVQLQDRQARARCAEQRPMARACARRVPAAAPDAGGTRAAPRQPGARSDDEHLALAHLRPGARADAGPERPAARQPVLRRASTTSPGRAARRPGRRSASRITERCPTTRCSAPGSATPPSSRSPPSRGRWCSASRWRCCAAASRAAGSSTARIFILPILIPGIVIGAIWKLMLNFDFGLINQALGLVGLGAARLAGRRRRRRCSRVIVVDIWHWTPFCFLLFLAGLEVPAAGRLRGRQDRRRVGLAGARPRHPADDAADDPGHLRLPPRPRLQGLRRGLPADRRRPGHRDRGRELHALPALLHRGPGRLRRGHVGRRHLPRLAAARPRAVGAQAQRRRSA